MYRTSRVASRRSLSGRMTGLLAVAALVATGCGGQSGESQAADTGEGEGTIEYPLVLENCGVEITFDAPPERVVFLHSAPVTSFKNLGLMDRVVARAGAFPDDYYDEETRRSIADVPSLAEDVDDGGHFMISVEAVIAQDADLVMGTTDGVSRESLAEAGIPQLIVPSQCPGATLSPDFEDVYALNEFYGQIFDRPAAAAAYNDELRARVDAILSEVEDEDRTAAILYPTVGGGTGYAYGNVSMAHPQVEAAGFDNVFGDVDERVFEVTLEELIGRDPDVLVLLHIDGEPGPVEDAIRSLPGADGLKAVQDDAIHVHLFNFSEPPTPLAIDGLERIVAAFQTP